MEKQENTFINPVIQQLKCTQALAHAEWETVQRIIDIQSEGIRRLMTLPNGFAKLHDGNGRSPKYAAAHWSGLYQQAFSNAVEASAISMDMLSEIHAEMLKTSHQIMPMIQRELVESVDQVSRAMAAIPALTSQVAAAQTRSGKAG